jgi:hypothetical protein
MSDAVGQSTDNREPSALLRAPRRLLDAMLGRGGAASRAVLLWGVLLLLFAAFSAAGAARVAPTAWNLGAGLASLVIVSLGPSPTRRRFVVFAVIILVDLLVVGFAPPDIGREGALHLGTLAALALRLVASVFVLYAVIDGYNNSQRRPTFEHGFRGPARRRREIRPTTLRIAITPICLGALLIGQGLRLFAETERWVANAKGKAPAVVEEPVAPSPPVEAPAVPVPLTEAQLHVLASSKAVESLEDLGVATQRIARQGMTFGAKSDEMRCLIEGLQRLDRCPEEVCRRMAGIFLRAALPKARSSAGFCDGVPPPLAEEQTEAWSERVCTGRALPICLEFYRGVQGHCHPNDTGAPGH